MYILCYFHVYTSFLFPLLCEEQTKPQMSPVYSSFYFVVCPICIEFRKHSANTRWLQCSVCVPQKAALFIYLCVNRCACRYTCVCKPKISLGGVPRAILGFLCAHTCAYIGALIYVGTGGGQKAMLSVLDLLANLPFETRGFSLNIVLGDSSLHSCTWLCQACTWELGTQDQVLMLV